MLGLLIVPIWILESKRGVAMDMKDPQFWVRGVEALEFGWRYWNTPPKGNVNNANIRLISAIIYQAFLSLVDWSSAVTFTLYLRNDGCFAQMCPMSENNKGCGCRFFNINASKQLVKGSNFSYSRYHNWVSQLGITYHIEDIYTI